MAAGAKLYGSVNGQTKEISTLYGSVNNQTKEIKKLYGSINGQTKLIYEKRADVEYGTVYYKANASDPDSAIQSAELQSVTEFNSLVYQDIFHTSWTALIDNGSVTVSNDSTNVIVGISIGRLITAIPDNFLGFCSYLTQPITIPDGVSTIGDAFLYSCSNFNSPITIPGTVTSIGGRFLGFCTLFNQPITIPNSVSAIEDSFMTNCEAFNSTLTLPNALTSIGRLFLTNAYSFNQNITLPSTLTKIGTVNGIAFLYDCSDMTGIVNVGNLSSDIIGSDTYTLSARTQSSQAYTTGITIAGANRAAWLSKFPNSQTTPYRKLIDAGY